jgi:hypothetical protein
MGINQLYVSFSFQERYLQYGNLKLLTSKLRASRYPSHSHDMGVDGFYC